MAAGCGWLIVAAVVVAAVMAGGRAWPVAGGRWQWLLAPWPVAGGRGQGPDTKKTMVGNERKHA